MGLSNNPLSIKYSPRRGTRTSGAIGFFISRAAIAAATARSAPQWLAKSRLKIYWLLTIGAGNERSHAVGLYKKTINAFAIISSLAITCKMDF